VRPEGSGHFIWAYTNISRQNLTKEQKMKWSFGFEINLNDLFRFVNYCHKA
jgi:hypothetical protein